MYEEARANIEESKEYEILTPESLKYYEGLAEKGENVFIDSLSMDEITIHGRVTSGVKMINLDKGVTVAQIAKVREKISDGDHSDLY